MADKIQRGMSDKGTLRDPSKMVSNNRGVWYVVIALVVLAFAGFTLYSVTSGPIQTPPATTTP